MDQQRPILELQEVGKTYGATRAVGPIDLSVQQGEFLTLLGPSGCGKTTTLHIIAGLVAPTTGRVRAAGRDLTHVPPPQRDMGVVFQSYALFPHRTVFENVAFGLRMRRIARPEIERRVRAMLEIVGLPAVEGRLPDQLSGGQRQRVALARALVIEPTVLLLDEPLSNLDALLRKRMRQEVRDLQRRLGITTIFVTHDQDEAFEMSDRVALLEAGHIVQIGRPEALYDEPATRFVAEFIGEANLIEGRVTARTGLDGTVSVLGGTELPARFGVGSPNAGERALVMIRPERLTISEDEAESEPSFAATITRRVFSGETLQLALATADGVELLCTKPSLPKFRDLVPGRSVRVLPGECRVLAEHR
jgi:ABC-type Fe3+/spermidine/putrescine transport system ATPase subunit